MPCVKHQMQEQEANQSSDKIGQFDYHVVAHTYDSGESDWKVEDSNGRRITHFSRRETAMEYCTDMKFRQSINDRLARIAAGDFRQPKRCRVCNDFAVYIAEGCETCQSCGESKCE